MSLCTMFKRKIRRVGELKVCDISYRISIEKQLVWANVTT